MHDIKEVYSVHYFKISYIIFLMKQYKKNKIMAYVHHNITKHLLKRARLA